MYSIKCRKPAERRDRMKILYFDCTCGISGDMALRALMEVSGAGDRIKEKMKSAVPAGDEKSGSRRGGSHEHGHGHGRSYTEVKRIIEESGSGEAAVRYAKAIYAVIAEAEAAVHGETPDTVHFHEVGRDEAVKNALGMGMAMEEISPDRVYVSDIYDGRGTVICSHGEIPVPVPAVMAMRENSDLIFREADVDTEMVTPSGLAALMGLGAVHGEMPEGKIIGKATARGSRDTGMDGLKVYLVEI